MAGANSYAGGLCGGCVYADSCALRDKRGSDALYCELFDPHGLSPDGDTDRLAGSDHSLGQAAPIDEDRTVGLCANCAERETCTLPRPEEGVWHCSEYK